MKPTKHWKMGGGRREFKALYYKWWTCSKYTVDIYKIITMKSPSTTNVIIIKMNFTERILKVLSK
jgi:hypothetical protein